ncbi:MAG: class I mannose-6-phosphate isomerase [Christensenellales bacterium]
MDIQQLVTRPIFFEKNRVYRIYQGGKGYAQLCSDGSEDGYFPEEWIASKVKAINPRYFGERDGVSVVKDTKIFFDDLLEQYPDQLLGGKKYDCLVKYLDSAIRLPMQVHPTKEFSRKNFGSEYGKTEAWLVVATRPGAKIYFGFNRPVTKEELWKLEERSLEEPDVMESILNGVDAKVGDTYLIKGGLIHAIGQGCTIIEVQEPTDFTIQPENWCGEYRISEEEKYIGLDKSTALDCFDYSLWGQKSLDSAKITPEIVACEEGCTCEKIIDYDDTPCFAQYRYTLSDGKMNMKGSPSVWIVLDGKCSIEGQDYRKEIVKGDYFFLPYSADGEFELKGNGVLIECLPSKQ